MTFAKQLARLREAHPLFATHYIKYEELKAAVESVDVPKVMAILKRELDKINDIVEVEWEAISGELKVRRRKDIIDLESLDNFSDAIIRLHVFVETNYNGFAKIMQKCADRQETSSCSWFMARVEAASFRQRNFDALLVPLGQLYARWRQQQRGGGEAATHGLGAQALSPLGEGNCQTFFVPSHEVMKIKVALLKKLLPDATVQRTKTGPGTRDALKVASELSKAQVNIFLDNSVGVQYAERYKRRISGFSAVGPTGVLVRCRVLAPPQGEEGAPGDPTDPMHEVQVTVEDGDGNTTECTLPQKAMPGLLAGNVDPKVTSPTAEAAAAAVRQLQLRPAVSAAFNRSTFKSEGPNYEPGSDLVSIDERVFFRDEAALADTKAWCFAASKTGAATVSSPQVPFTGAILRVWLPATGCSSLLGFLNLGLSSEPVTGFSEGLHGMALMHRELAVPLPPWIPGETLTRAANRSTLLAPSAAEAAPAETKPKESGKSPAKPEKPPATKEQAKDTSGGKGLLACCFGRSPAADAKLQVDPKTPMAIERTLLRWMRSTVLLATLSSYLISANNFSMQINGILLSLVSLLFVIMPTRTYLERSRELQNPKSKQPKVDRTLPRTLAWSLCLILAATLYVSVYASEGGVV